MGYETKHSETVYLGKAFDVRRDQILLPDGKETTFDVVVHPGAVTLIPIDSAGRILFVRQYRYAIGEELLELPAGTLDEGEEPEACAHREIREETGMSAGKLEKIGEFFLVPGYSTEYMYIYLASDLKPDPLPGDEDEFITVEAIAVQKIPELISQGILRDAKSLSALFLAEPYLSRNRVD
ncbi:MAG: NUDIX hydrolase [Chloroflexota bacterium]|nr:MAG: NUDIX hydrolase [Chloroflexota bacterium]UCF28596.1 MAG: NUDIX hydrolase [Chloroflexota bacterium]